MALAEFRLEERAGIPILNVIGEVDVWNVDLFRAAIRRAEALGTQALIVSLGEATYLCARAYGILTVLGFRLAQQQPRPRSLVICCPDSHLACRILRLLEFPDSVVPTVEAALALAVDSTCAEPAHQLETAAAGQGTLSPSVPASRAIDRTGPVPTT